MKFFYSPGTSSQLVHIVLRESDLVFGSIRVDEHTKAMGKGADSWLNFFSAEVHVGCFCPLFHSDLPAAAKTVFHERLEGRLAYVERHLAGREYLMGSDFSVADAYLFVVSSWARPADVDFSPYPNILGLRKRVGARPAVQSVMRAENEPGPLLKS